MKRKHYRDVPKLPSVTEHNGQAYRMSGGVVFGSHRKTIIPMGPDAPNAIRSVRGLIDWERVERANRQSEREAQA